MLHFRPVRTTALIMLSLLTCGAVSSATTVSTVKLNGVPRIKQMKNYCGPACVAAVMQYYGKDTTQREVGEEVYDPTLKGTNGADMLYYALEHDFAAYSWNSNLDDLKKKLDAGAPVIVLQQNSKTDWSGHYRVVTGYDDGQKKLFVMDPYYDAVHDMGYDQFDQWWKRMGYWSLVIVPLDKDPFASELGRDNCVLYMDLSYAKFRRKNYDEALKDAKLALNVEPRNTYARSLLRKIETAMGAGAK